MRIWFRRFVVCYCLVLVVSAARAEEAELLPTETEIARVIDHYIDARLKSENIQPSPPATDGVFLRRVTLDLAGRIPTTVEAKAYVADDDPHKRDKLIEALLSSPDFAFHQRNELDSLLLARLKTDAAWRAYLLTATRENRPWDQMFREMMTGQDESAEKKNPALEFLRARSDNAEKMTDDTSKLFFGVSINCAKCHDHPLVDDWKQDHFYGMTSFFSRTYRTKKGTLAEKPSGLVKFKPLYGDEKQASFMFLSGTIVEEPQRELNDEQKKAEEAEVKRQREDDKAPMPAAPEFSPRNRLVETALQAENSHFLSRSIVNRIWQRLMGLALIDPPDQLHSENPASHPQLLDWLARDLVTHGYDLKRLVRGIVSSEAYARSSRWDNEGEPPSVDLFATAIVRPLSPRQYSLSLRIASSDPFMPGGELSSDEWAQKRESLENEAGAFAGRIEQPGESFSVSVDEALLFSNSADVQSNFLNESDDRLVGQLQKIEDARELITTAFWAILTRAPNEEELATLQKYLEARQDRRTEGLKQITWALLCSPEMRFNY